MNNTDRIKIFLVDDDAVFLKSLEIDFLHHGDFDIETYPTGEKCIENLTHMPDLVILDYHLDGIELNAINGIDTLDAVKAFKTDLPVIMLSSQDKIDVAINCMHHHAIDYVVKSETSFLRLQKIISNLYEIKRMEKELKWYMDRM